MNARVSTLPTVHGEGLVMRVLDRESIRGTSPTWVSANTFESYTELLKCPRDLVLTGPTGSGKTTTLYVVVQHGLDSLKIITVEDPVEYQLTESIRYRYRLV